MKGFQCKQFFIRHENSAMKVGTDSLLLGSWSQSHQLKQGRILDIGAGSGILSLMLAQKTPAEVLIDAVELDHGACCDSRYNFNLSPFVNRLSVIETNINVYRPLTQYHWVISNPPYFNAGQDFDRQRQQARHRSSLNWDSLLANSQRLLTSCGKLEVVIPAAEADAFAQSANEHGFFIKHQLTVFSQPGQDSPIRHLYMLDQYSGDKKNDTLYIYNANRQYSEEYKKLCRHYYLNF
ncbi:tRNA1(Val) (adenine(37)-N6)-methyltransferase [Gayadomonas joobiniege]|uniref:tRNA1(Val) (adenine(37)-N6)-methyltransferase n=1 Tax=Gayadomonas joobiniege TaxID=1234606 RepID=UPI000370F5B3|nr:methyltransferase [Gayadomonas joobiniege]